MMEYFTLENKNALIELHGRKAKFAIKEDFMAGWSESVRGIMREIVLELEKRNFMVPGYKCNFHLDVDAAKVRLSSVYAVEKDFKLISDYDVVVKGRRVSMHCDRSGSMDEYVGSDWEADREEFMNGKMFHRAMDNKKRINLHYDFRNGRWATFSNCFVATTDHREHQRIDEPEAYSYQVIMGEMRQSLVRTLEDIMSEPIPEKIDVFTEPEPVELTNPIIKEAKIMGFRPLRYGNPKDEFKGLKPGLRLLSLSNKLPENHPYAEHLHDGFVYMEIDNYMLEPNFTDAFNGYEYRDPVCEAYEVKPKKWDNMWVMDAGVIEKLKKEWFDKQPEDVHKMPMDEYRKIVDAQLATMVHVNDYEGGYMKPILVTNRRILKEECNRIHMEEWANS